MKWEYKIVHFHADTQFRPGLPKDLSERFDQLGDEGWELVRIEPILDGGGFILGIGRATRTEALVGFFKRPKG